MSDILQLEAFGSDISNTTSLILCDTGTELWLPYEFLPVNPVTRILLIGEHGAGTRGLVAGEKWTTIFDMTGVAGSKNWSILASIMKHLIGPVLVVITPDIAIPASFFGYIGNNVSLIVYRWLSECENLTINASTIFFPLSIQHTHIIGVQRAIWRGMGLRTSDANLAAIIQETRPQGLCLASSILESGIVSLSWYRTKDSNDLVLAERQNSLAMWLNAISNRVVKILQR
jgi:hypothetical protein